MKLIQLLYITALTFSLTACSNPKKNPAYITTLLETDINTAATTKDVYCTLTKTQPHIENPNLPTGLNKIHGTVKTKENDAKLYIDFDKLILSTGKEIPVKGSAHWIFAQDLTNKTITSEKGIPCTIHIKTNQIEKMVLHKGTPITIKLTNLPKA
jgi:hypothetical protein